MSDDESAEARAAKRGGRQSSTKRKRPPVPDSSTQELQDQQFHFPDDNLDTSCIPSEYRTDRSSDPNPPTSRRRHLVYAVPVAAFAQNATTFADFREDPVYQTYKRGLALFSRIYAALAAQPPPENASATDVFRHRDVDPLFYIELVAGPESDTLASLSGELKTMKTNNDPQISGAYQDIAKTLDRQMLRNLNAFAWRFHIIYLETHPLWMYRAKRLEASNALDGKENTATLLEELRDREESFGTIRGSRLSAAFSQIQNDISARLAEEEESGASHAAAWEHKGNMRGRTPSRPAPRKDPFEHFRSVADIFHVLKDATQIFNVRPAKHPIPLDHEPFDMEDPGNPWSFARIFSLERVLGFFSSNAFAEQGRLESYQKGEFPMPARVWYLAAFSVKKLWQGRMFNVEDPDNYGLRHAHLEEVMRTSDLTTKVNFLKYRLWVDKVQREMPVVIPDLLLPLLTQVGGVHMDRNTDFSEIKQVVEPAGDESDAAVRVKRRRQLDGAVQAAVRDHIRSTSYFRPDAVLGVTWNTLLEDNNRRNRELEETCARLRSCGVAEEKVTSMRARMQLQKKIDMVHKVDKFIADAPSNEKVSDADKAIAQYGTAFLRKHESFYHFLADNKAYSTLSVFGEYLNWLALLWRHVFQCNRNVPVCMLLFVSLFHQYRPCKMNPHVLLVGDQSAGKSFLLDVAFDMFIKGTLFDFAAMSDKAQHVTGDISGKGYLCQELDPEIFGGAQSNPKGKKEAQSTTTTEALWKNKLTSNTIFGEVFDRDKDGKRITLKIEVLANCTYVFCTNYEGTQSHKSAMKSRFIILELPPNSEHNKAKVSNLARQGEVYEPHQESQFEKFRMIQHLVWKASHLIGIKGMRDPDLRTGENFARQILERAAALGAVDTGEIRKVDRLLMNLETFVIITAVWGEFVMNGSRPKGGSYDPESILNLEARMVATAEQTRFCLELHAAQFEDRVQTRIAQALQKQYMPDPSKCLIYRRCPEQVPDPTKPHWQMYEKEKNRLLCNGPLPIETDDDSQIRASLEMPTAVPVALVGFFEKIKSIQRAGNIVWEKVPPQKDEKEAKYEYFLVDTERIGVPKEETFDVVTEEQIKGKIFSLLRDELGTKFTDQQIRNGYNHCIETTMKRATSNPLFKEFRESEKSIFALSLTETPIQFDVTGVQRVCLTIATSFLYKRVESPIQYAAVEMLSHKYTPRDALFVRGMMIHPHSGMWAASTIPVNPRRDIFYKHVTDISETEIYNIAKSVEQEAPCVDGSDCVGQNCPCQRRKYDARKVLMPSKTITYTTDPDTASFDERCKDTGWDESRLKSSFVWETLTPARVRGLAKWRNLRDYRDDIANELKRFGDGYTDETKTTNALASRNRTPSSAAPSEMTGDRENAGAAALSDVRGMSRPAPNPAGVRRAKSKPRPAVAVGVSVGVPAGAAASAAAGRGRRAALPKVSKPAVAGASAATGSSTFSGLASRFGRSNPPAAPPAAPRPMSLSQEYESEMGGDKENHAPNADELDLESSMIA